MTWPDGDEVVQGEKRPAGRTVGAIKVEIANRRGELVQKLPGAAMRKLLVEQKILWHCEARGKEVTLLLLPERHFVSFAQAACLICNSQDFTVANCTCKSSSHSNALLTMFIAMVSLKPLKLQLFSVAAHSR